MTEKINDLKGKLSYNNTLLRLSQRAMDESHPDSSVFDLFKNQVARIYQAIQELKKQLAIQELEQALDAAKLAKTGKKAPPKKSVKGKAKKKAVTKKKRK